MTFIKRILGQKERSADKADDRLSLVLNYQRLQIDENRLEEFERRLIELCEEFGYDVKGVLVRHPLPDRLARVRASVAAGQGARVEAGRNTARRTDPVLTREHGVGRQAARAVTASVVEDDLAEQSACLEAFVRTLDLVEGVPVGDA